ncbi:4-hydroxybenzoate polyprenyltransferase, mitochondrial [Smittium culicis]|uniref:4-hydroxybenzoate polyprenyltransferase, mitochondrial n=1 Tax=Smittium culicis TaxID=133412 RepID=A0A1R1X1T4_9FUNG|nr:4-hydroxybenzoate polyprenyltransferase, mitochondrial [Smittium culicis]
MTGSLDLAVVAPLYLSGISWTLVYDTVYAHQDKADDVQVGVKSTALLFGAQTKPVLAAFSLSTIALLAASGYFNHSSYLFYTIACGAGSAHLFWLLRGVDLNSTTSCWKAFSSYSWFGFIVFFALVCDYSYRSFFNPKQSDESLLAHSAHPSLQ